MRTRNDGRWKPVPDYHPYMVTGDFNRDGMNDFAVVVVKEHAEHDFSLLVLNGPLDFGKFAPSFR